MNFKLIIVILFIELYLCSTERRLESANLLSFMVPGAIALWRNFVILEQLQWAL